MKYLKLKFLLMFFALAMAIPPAWAETKTDELTISKIGITGSSYQPFSNITVVSDAVYAGQCSGGPKTDNPCIQLRSSNDNSGVISTSSGGKVKSVTILYNSATSSNKQVNIYCSNSAYSSASNLFDASEYGTAVGSVSGKTGESKTLTINGDYSYVGIRSNNGAVYIDKITIVWETGGSSLTPVTTFAFPQSSYSVTLGDSFPAPTLTVDPAAAAGEVVYSSSNTDVATVNASTGAVTPVGVGTTRIIATNNGSTTYQNMTTYYDLTVLQPPVTYKLVTDVTKLAAGDKIILVGLKDGNAYAMGEERESNGNFGQVSVDIDNNTITTATAQILTLGESSDYWTFKLANGKYLYAASSSANQLKASASPANDNEKAEISISNSEATIQFKGTNTRNYLQYNSGSGLFSCYASGQSPVYIYRDVSNDPVVPELEVNKTELILKEPATDTFTVTGTNLVDDVGVPNNNHVFTTSYTGGMNWGFERDANNEVHGTVTVTYEGRELKATDTFYAGTKKSWDPVEEISIPITVTYQPDIWLYGDFSDNQGWRYADQMEYANGVYTAEFTTTARTCLLFARTTGQTYGWVGDKSRYFIGAQTDGGNWVLNNDLVGNLDFYGNTGNQYHPIELPNAGHYIITIDPATKKFTIDVTLEQVKAPTFSPGAGTYNYFQPVTISCATEGASIYYTTDESEPSAENGTLYENEITLQATTTIKAIAVKEGMRPSTITEALYTLPQTVNTLTQANGLATADGVDFIFTGNAVVTYAGTSGGKNYVWLRDKDATQGGGVFYEPVTSVTTQGAVLSPNWSATSKVYRNWVELTNADHVENSGNTASFTPFDRTGIKIGDAHVNEYIQLNNVTIDEDSQTTSGGINNYTATYVGENRDEPITYIIRDMFGTDPVEGKTYNITATVGKYNNNIQVYPTELVEVPQVATPTFSPNGGEFTAAQEVTISCATENAKIYYSLDRENWTEGTTLTVDRSGKVYAKATKANMQDSEVAEATFTINYPAITVTLEPETETYTVGDEAKVKVTVANTVGTATVTYMTGETAETANTSVTPDEDGYITIPTTEAGTVVLKVTASDAYHAEPVTAIGTYTINHKALTITLTPENAEFNVGAQDTKVKVDIDNVVGELVEDYKATYTYNGEEKTLTLTRENGYITLPNDKAVTYNVTATVMDERMDDVTATGTYTFTALPAITFDLSTDQVNYTVGDVVKVKATDITGTFGEYDVTYMIGETQLIPDNDGYVTFTSDEVGDVTLTVTVEDLYEHESAATQEITFHFAAGGPISITLTADPEAETYTVGDVVNVKVTTNGTIGNDNDVLITYTTDFESKAESTYDPKKGIDITSDKAGDVTLTVNVYDGYAHEGADENGITTKTADYTFVKAPAINITFDPASGTEFTVGQEAKVKVTIAGAADDYEAEYKIGDNVVEPVDGYIVLPNTATDDVTLTVSVYDGIDRIGADESGFTTATATYTFSPMPVVAAPTFSLVAGTYGKAQQLTITAENGANILYSTDGSEPTTPYNGAIDLGQGTTTVKAVATKDGFAKSPVVTATYIIDIPEELPTITPFKGYYQIKNNGNKMYANIAGRKTLNFTDAENAKKMAGTVIWLETNDKGQVQSIRSQAADLQGYANRAMRYVPQMVDIVVNKINQMEGIEDATGPGSVLGETGLDAIMEKFNECFDYHLYVEQAQGGWRLYGKTPNMQHVVDFYRDHKDQVEAKLPKLEQFINDALHKLINKIGGSTVFTDFSLRQIWENMGGNLPEPVVGDDAAIMDFYRAVLNNKNYVWDFAYQTAQIYWGNVKSHPRYEELKAQLGEYADYIDEFVTQVRPDFKYYVIQRGDEPDYISEGNGEIISNQPHTIWTLEPRTDFTVNIAGEQFGCPYAGGVGGYATTNYTDFAYTVPEGVTAYKVASVENGVANLQALSGVIPAQTPVLLMAKTAGDYVLKLSTEAGTKVTGNLLVGVDSLITRFQLKTPMVVSLFTLAQGVLGEQLYNQYVAQYEYLQLLYAGTVNNKYFWGLNSTDTGKCVYINENNEQDCVIRNLGNGEFVNDWAAPKTNKAFLLSETDQTITISTLKGDVNHDGYVNIADVTALIDRLLGDESHSCSYCSDVNSNNDVNIKDVTDLIDILLRSGADTHVDTPTPDPEGGDGN